MMASKKKKRKKKEKRINTYEMPLSAISVTNTPPPAAANAAPKELSLGSATMQPWLPLALEEQSVEMDEGVDWTGLTCVQPSRVWRLIWLRGCRLTPSKVSISPPEGQADACDHLTEEEVGQGRGELVNVGEKRTMLARRNTTNFKFNKFISIS